MKPFASKTFQAVLFLLSISTIHAESIIFDLGGVLVETNKVTAFKEIGLKNLLKYVIEQKQVRGVGTKLQDSLFDFLETVRDRSPDCQEASDKGRLLPQCMCDWLAGTTPPEELLNTIKKTAQEYPEFFTSSTEQEIILSIATMMFTPEKFIHTRKLNKAGLKLVQACKEAGHTLYILSNWDPISFGLLQQAFPELFQLFDGMVISGTVGQLKPDKKIYEHLLSIYHLDPQETIFLDDRPENLDTAGQLGITTILCTPEKVKTFDQVYDELNAWLRSRHNSVEPSA